MEGKARSSKNAFRHGLAIPIDGMPDHSARRDRIEGALRITEELSNDEARELADIVVNLSRVRLARIAALAELSGNDFPTEHSLINARTLITLQSTDRYESEARAKLRWLLRRSSA
jgi:hypothetical protein